MTTCEALRVREGPDTQLEWRMGGKWVQLLGAVCPVTQHEGNSTLRNYDNNPTPIRKCVKELLVYTRPVRV
jgi:hypothetical protein